jgi:hypothetical protein
VAAAASFAASGKIGQIGKIAGFRCRARGMSIVSFFLSDLSAGFRQRRDLLGLPSAHCKCNKDAMAGGGQNHCGCCCVPQIGRMPCGKAAASGEFLGPSTGEWAVTRRAGASPVHYWLAGSNSP